MLDGVVLGEELVGIAVLPAFVGMQVGPALTLSVTILMTAALVARSRWKARTSPPRSTKATTARLFAGPPAALDVGPPARCDDGMKFSRSPK